MNKLPKDALFSLALELNLPDLLSFCTSSKRINDLICRKNDIWIAKLNMEYPNYNPMFRKDTPRQTYTLLYDLTNLKNKLGLEESIQEIYQMKRLYLGDNQIKEIPKEIGPLTYNQIKEIPKELTQLHNLQELYLNENQIKEIPKEIGQLHNLQNLSLERNQIKEIPKEIGQLHNLKELWLTSNQIKEIPKELKQLHNLQYLWLYDNQIKEIPKEIHSLPDLTLVL